MGIAAMVGWDASDFIYAKAVRNDGTLRTLLWNYIIKAA